jgi:hypothetical protein
MLNNSYTCNKNISVKDLYQIYSNHTFYKNNKPFEFFAQVNLIVIFLFNYKVLKSIKLDNQLPGVIYISIFFFKKTYNVFNSTFTNNFVTSQKVFFSRDSQSVSDYVHAYYTFFWKKWKKLKRPKTKSKYNTFIIEKTQSIIKSYYDLNLLKSSNNLIIISSVLKYKKLVTFSKSLLDSPKFNSTSINKLLNPLTYKNFEFQFLRKNKVYNKGRYSRCRQNYRTGVYMCLYLSIVSIFGLYYWFYKFSFNFTYLWWLFIAFISSFFLPKIIKYRLYEPKMILNCFVGFFKWLLMVVKCIFYK